MCYNVVGVSLTLSSPVQFFTDELGPMTVVSTDPTNSDTAFGMLSDFLNAVRPAGRC